MESGASLGLPSYYASALLCGHHRDVRPIDNTMRFSVHCLPAVRVAASLFRFASISHGAFLSPFATVASTTFCARRFSSSAQRPSTYSEVVEACSVLGVGVDCDPKHLKKTYRELVQKNHPDAGGDAATMSRITVAYNRLKGLSKMEREQFKAQHAAYRGGGHYYGGNSSRGVGTAASSRGPFGGFANQAAQNPGGNYDYHDAGNSEHFSQSSRQQHGYYAYQQRGRSFTENPFSTSNPFSIHAQVRRAWSMPMGSILLRAFVFYLGFSILMLLAYRRYRDWLHDDGWKMAESYARHERLAELQRLRQEMNERIQEARAAAAGSHDRIESLRNPIIRPFSSEAVTDYNAVTTSKERELRALERVRRQRIEDKMMVKGWPSIPDEKGKLVVQAQYPPGVVFFEPHRTDDRLRQVANLHEGRVRSESLQKEREAAGVGGEGGGAAVAEVIQVILNSVREEKS